MNPTEYRVIGMDNGCEVREFPDGSRQHVPLKAPPSGAPSPAAEEFKALTEELEALRAENETLKKALEEAEAKLKPEDPKDPKDSKPAK